MPAYVNRTGLATAFGVSMPTVDAWIKAGCPVAQRASKGVQWAFDPKAVMEWRIERAVAEATGEKVQDEDAIDLRKKKAQMLRAELEVAEAMKLVAPIREFERAMAKMCAEIRSNVLNVPQRVVTQLVGCTDEAQFKVVLRAELVLALQAASNAELTLSDEESTENEDAG